MRKKTLGFVSLLIGLLGFHCSAFSAEYEHPGGMHTKAQIEAVKEKLALGIEPWESAYAQLLEIARRELERRPQPVEDFNVPGFYYDAEGHMAEKARMRDDSYAAYALGLAYQLAGGGERKNYAAKCAEILDAWATTNTTISGFDGKLVTAYAGVLFVIAADLIWDYDGWGQESRTNFMRWTREVYLVNVNGSKRRANNHGAWGEFASIAAAHLLDDHELMASDTELLKKRIAETIDKNGELPHENKRTNNGMWYTYFALAPMTASANIIRNATGVDLFHYTAPNGRNIKMALDRHFEYCMAPEKWPYDKPDGPMSGYYNMLYPSGDKVKIPSPSSWPNNMLEPMAAEYGEKQWAEWIAPYRPITSARAWLFPTLMLPADVLSSADE